MSYKNIHPLVLLLPRADGPCSLLAFAERHGLSLVVSETSQSYCRQHGRQHRWTATFSSTTLDDNGRPVFEGGTGETPRDAIQAYCECIEGKKLIEEGGQDRDFLVPNDLSLDGLQFDENGMLVSVTPLPAKDQYDHLCEEEAEQRKNLRAVSESAKGGES